MARSRIVNAQRSHGVCLGLFLQHLPEHLLEERIHCLVPSHTYRLEGICVCEWALVRTLSSEEPAKTIIRLPETKEPPPIAADDQIGEQRRFGEAPTTNHHLTGIEACVHAARLIAAVQTALRALHGGTPWLVQARRSVRGRRSSLPGNKSGQLRK